jgi:hypothetical protein
VEREVAIPKRPKIGGFWGEQPGAGGTAHSGTVARPTSYYDFCQAKFSDFFCAKRARLVFWSLREEKLLRPGSLIPTDRGVISAGIANPG